MELYINGKLKRRDAKAADLDAALLKLEKQTIAELELVRSPRESLLALSDDLGVSLQESDKNGAVLFRASCAMLAHEARNKRRSLHQKTTS